MITNYFKTAWRSLLFNKGMTALNIVGLAVGMTAAVLIFLWVDNELSFDRYQPGSDRTYSMITRLPTKNSEWEGAPMLLADAVKKEVPGVEKVTRLITDNQPVFRIGEEIQYQKKCAYVDPNWFDVFSYSFIAGNAGSFGNDPYSLVLTASAAKRYFGNAEAVGQTIRVDSLFYTVRGIVPDAPANSSFQYEAYMPIAGLLTNPQWQENGENWGNSDYRTFVWLAPGMRADAAERQLSAVLRRYSHSEDASFSIGLESLADLHFDNSHSDSIFDHGNRPVVLLFSLLGLVILAVACINYVNLTTAKASLRSKEVSIRKIVGAERRQLFFQFVTESFLISGFSLAVTMLLVWVALPGFAGLTGKDLSGAFESAAMGKVLGGTLAVAFVLNSVYPALLLSSFRPLNVFRGITVLKVKDSYLRKGLVVVQFGVSILLMTSTVVIYRQLRFIQKTGPGYDREQLMMVMLPRNVQPDVSPEDAQNHLRVMKQQLLSHSGIEQVSLVSQPIAHIGSVNNGADWEGRDTSVTKKVAQLSADADLQKTLHLELTAGRWFRSGDRADEQNYILNETAVRELNIRQPVIGAYFRLHGSPGKVVGVVKDFHFKSLHEKTGPLVIFNNPSWGHFFLIRTAPQGADAAVAAVKAIWKQAEPGLPLEYEFVNQQFNNLYRGDAIASALILIFAVIAVFISSLGLFGLAAFAAERRTREIGIRKILGATTASIGRLLSGEFVKLVVVAIVIATPLAWWAMNGWLQNFAYRVGLSWWMFVLPGAFALTLAMGITGWQAVRASWKNPVKSLRVE
ncbi:ABC transporter permease [Puia sp.]|uniref:ABC transporter permease n=1 Tax=Puia sp. TaxID=2045100 RepID=UPI002F3ED9DD